MSKGGGSQEPQYVSAPSNQTTTTTSTPWSGQEPYLSDVFAKGKYLSGNVLNYYSGNVPGVPQGQTYPPLSTDTQTALALNELTALTDQTPQNASNYVNSMLSGKFLDAGNPYFSNMLQSTYNQITPLVESAYSKAGRYGSGAMDQALASSMTEAAGNLAYQNYGDVLKSMGNAAYLAPQTAQLQYYPAQQIAAVGGALEDQTQNAINQTTDSWQFNQLEPWQRLGLYNNMIQGNYGGTSVSTGSGQTGQWYNPYSSNSLAGAGSMMSGLGGLGLLGYAMYSGGLFSDKRTKENIKPVDDKASDIIDRLIPVTFDYKSEYGDKDQAGFVADDVEKVLPGLVHRNPDNDMRMIAPMGFIPYMVKALQEQQDKIDYLYNKRN